MAEVIMPKMGDAMTEGKVVRWYKKPGDAVKKGEAVAEIAASITEAMFDELDAPVYRVTGEDVPMPYARNLELLATPHEEHIAAAVKKVMYANG